MCAIAMGLLVQFKVTLFIILGVTIFSGVFFCGWICPFGFIQDIFSTLGNIFGIKKRKLPIIMDKALSFVRYIFLLLIVLYATDWIFYLMSFDPRANFEQSIQGHSLSIASLVMIVLFSIISMFYERCFCNYFCFQGARYGLISYFRIFSITRNNISCVNCKKCDKVCPMNIEITAYENLRSIKCINCFKCISICPVKNTLSFGFTRMNSKEKKNYAIAFLCALLLIGSYKIFFNHSHKPHSNPPKNISTSKGSIYLHDGVYTGIGKGFRGDMIVDVTIKNSKIVGVTVTDNVDDKKWFDRANNVIPAKIIETQSTNIDVVSGATYSSIGIIEGVNNALKITE